MFPRALLRCLHCGSDLKEDTTLHCTSCTQEIPLTPDGVPVFMENTKAGEVAVHTAPKSTLKKVFRFLKPPHHSIYLDNLGNTHFEGKELQKLIDELPSNAKVVNIGALSRRLQLRKDIHIYNIDISIYPNVDLVADGHNLPIKDETFDLILLKNVLEHVKDPATILKEAHRILKPGGILYIKNPFMQPYHAVPDDFYRWTNNGNKELFKGFKQEDFGISIGPSSALSWILREYLAMLFSFKSTKLYKLNIIIFGWLTFWIKYFDLFFRKHPMAHYLASAFYGVYRKHS